MTFQQLSGLVLFFANLCPLLEAHADRWDIAEGNTIVASTPAIFPANRMFGVPGTGGGELGSCIFSDNPPPNGIDIVEFRTQDEVPLIGYTLNSAADFGVPIRRGFRAFRLYADVDENGTYEKLVDDFIVVVQPQDNIAVRNFPLVIARRWRIEVQRIEQLSNPKTGVGEVDGLFYSGPRIVELDAIVAANPDLPNVTLVSPQEGSKFKEGNTLNFEVQAQDASHPIKRVQILRKQGETNSVIATVNQAPYRLSFPNASPGLYVIRAKAVDSYGGAGFSEEVTLTVTRSNPRLSFDNPFFDSGIGFTANLSGVLPGALLTIQSSPDLQKWTDVVSEIPEFDSYFLTDTSLQVLYYRAFQPY